MLKSTLTEKMTFDLIRYSMVWEDPDTLSRALDIRQSDVVLCIASAGCNVLSLALKKPRAIIALDFSPAQLALLELKMEGIRHLSRSDLLSLLGIGEGSPIACYDRVRNRLSNRAREFWDGSQDALRAGVMGAGKLEKYLAYFRTSELSAIWPSEVIDKFLAARTLDEQMAIFRSTDLARLRKAMVKYFARENFARNGRDPAQFEYVPEMDLADVLLGRFERLFSRHLMSSNFFLRYFLTGTYPIAEGQGSPYLLQTDMAELRAATDRIELVESDLESFLSRCPAGMISKLGLSDLFEYLSVEQAAKLFALIEAKLPPGGRLAFWNLFIARQPDAQASPRLQRLEPLSSELSASDRLWFYRDFNAFERLA